MLPPGQRARIDFPRFGLPQFASRFPSDTQLLKIEVVVNGGSAFYIDLRSEEFSRRTVKADFHCVTTWSYIGAVWTGVKLSDLLVKVTDQLDTERFQGAVFYGQDGSKTSLIFEDLLADNVIVADTLDGEPLTIKHGAPMRLIAPDHYGYKNLKHITRIELYSAMPRIKRGFNAFLDHPRARVIREERSRWIPGWILRYIYRFLIPGTVKDFEKAMRQYEGEHK